MSEEEIIEKIKHLIKSSNDRTDLLSYLDEKTKESLQGLLDLYNKEKEKNKELQYKLELEKIDNKYNQEERDEETILKYKIREKIKELDKKEKQELKAVKGQDRYFIKQIYHSKRSFGKDLLEEE